MKAYSRSILAHFIALVLVVAATSLTATAQVAYYQAEGTAADSSGNHHDGTAGSDVTYTTGRIGQGFNFPGNDMTTDKNAVQIPDSADLKPTNITVAVWVKFNSLTSATSGSYPNGEQIIVSKQNSGSFAAGSAFSYVLAKDGDNRLEFAADFSQSALNVVYSTTHVAVNRWYRVVATYDHQSFKLYVNGQLEGTVAETRDFDYAATPLILGRTNASALDGLFSGVLDEVQIFNTALTPAQIPAVDNNNLGTGLVSWWPGEGNANDIQGTNNGTFQNGATTSTGKVGQAFNTSPATSSYVSIPDSPSLYVNTLTIDMWVNFNSLNGVQVIFSKAIGAGDDDSYVIWYTGGALHATTGNNSNANSILDYAWTPNTHEWHHVAYTFDGATNQLYVDGQAVASGPNAHPPAYDNHAALIGADYSGPNITFFTDGQIDEVDLFDRALTGAEIQAIYTAGSAGKSQAPSLSVSDTATLAYAGGQNSLTFDVQVARPNGSPISVDYATLDGSALQSIDYTATAGTLNIPANATSATITVPVAGNTAPYSRTLLLNLRNAANATINRAYATGKIMTGNAVTDFIDGANNGADPWQYGITAPDGTGFTRYTSNNLGTSGPLLYWVGGPGNTSGIILNADSQNLVYNSGSSVQPPDLLGMYPSSDGSKTVVRWTAPAAGTYQITGRFQGIQHETSSDVAIVKNGDDAHPLLFTYINGFYTDPTVTSAIQTFSLKENLAAGDTIDFREGLGSDNSYTYDGTGLAATVVQLPNPVPLPAGCIAWWPGENAVGEVIGGHQASTVNGATYDTGKVGRAFSFNGTNQFLQVPDAAELNLANDFTIEGWLYHTANSPNAETIVSKRSGDDNNVAYALYLEPGGRVGFESRFNGGSYSAAFSTNSVATNAWVHVAATLTAGQLRFYINGALDSTASFTASRPSVSAPVTIGATIDDAYPASSPTGPLPGLIDELTLYNRALSSAEIATVAGAGQSGKQRDDLAMEFNTSVNSSAAGSANLPWIYGSMPPTLNVPAGFVPFAIPRLDNQSEQEWEQDHAVFGSGDRAGIGKNIGTTTITPAYLVLLPQQVALYPSVDLYHSVARWIAPAAGTYAVSATFSLADHKGTQKDIHVFFNGTELFGDVINTVGDGKSMTQVITVNPNDTVDFVMGPGNDGYSYDSTGLAASVVPLSLSATPAIIGSFPFNGGQLSIVGGTGPYQVSIVSGSLPAGLSISSTGLVTGTAQNGAYSFTLRTTDSLGIYSDTSFSGTLENPVPLPPSCIAWWPGQNAVGEVIGGHHASTMNGATYDTGKVGRAFSFDGVSQFLQVPDAPALNLAGDLTIEGWLYHTANSPNEETIVSKRSGDNNNVAYVVFLETDGRLGFSSRNSGGQFNPVFSPDPIAINAWVHIAVTLTDGNVRLYVNGALVSTTPYAFTRPTVTAPLTIGATITDATPANAPAGPLPGLIDDLTLYSRALTTGEIASIATAGQGGKARSDLARDFSVTTNSSAAGSANLPWIYGSMPPTLNVPAGFVPFAIPDLLIQNLHSWHQDPAVFSATDPAGIQKNTGTSTITTSQQTYLPQQISLFPSSNLYHSVARWVAPAAGNYAVSATFTLTDSAGTHKDIHVYFNGTELFGDDIYQVGDGKSTTITITVNANDTVDFIMGPGNDNYYSDNTGLAASVVLLPPPPTTDIAIEQPAGTNLTTDVSTVDFGTVNAGTPVVKTFTIKNDGLLDLTSLAVTADGTNSSDFVAGALGATTLAPGDSTTFTVTFTPSAGGARTAAIHVASNAPTKNPFNISLTGTGFVSGAQIAVEQPTGTALTNGSSTVDFGSNIAGAWVLRTFVIKNNGGNPLTGVAATIDGASGGDYSVTTAPATTIASGASSTLVVRFAGTALGARSAALHIASNDSTNNPFNVALTGVTTGTAIDATFNTAGDVPLTVAGLTAGGLAVHFTLHFAPPPGTTLKLVSNTGSAPIAGTFPGLPQGATVSLTYGSQTFHFTISYFGGDGNDIVLTQPGGGAVAWGDNSYGEAGDSTTGNSTTGYDKLLPVSVLTTGVLAGKTVTAVAAGDQHSLALTSDGQIFAWGHNNSGQLGDGTNNDSNVPVAVDMSGALAGQIIVAISAGSGVSVALANSGSVFTWGTFGLLGTGSTTSSNVPVPVYHDGVLAGRVITNISAGGGHVLVRDSAGLVYGWGNNSRGALGTGDTTSTFVPVAMNVSPITGAGDTVKAVSAGYGHSLILTAAGNILECGDNPYNQLGLGSSNSSFPFASSLVVPHIGDIGLSGGSIVAVCASTYSSYAITTTGQVISWGNPNSGELGIGTTTANSGQSPAYVDTTGVLQGKTITAISAGTVSAYALSSDGQLFAWGGGPIGNGNGDQGASYSPVAVDTSGVLAGKKATFLSAGSSFCLAIAIIPPAPSIVVQDSGGNPIFNGLTAVDLGTALPGNNTSRTLTILNAGTAPLTSIAITKNGANAGDFTIGSPGATTLAPGVSTTFNITFAPGASGAENAAIHIASNDAYSNPFGIALMGTGGIPITSWRQANFGISTNTGNAADTADPDNDGVSNLLEFAFGEDPNSPNSPASAPVATPGPTVIIYTYTRNKQAMAELVFQVEWNDALTPAGWSSTGVTETILSDNGLLQQVQATVPAGAAGHRYVHLKVTRP